MVQRGLWSPPGRSLLGACACVRLHLSSRGGISTPTAGEPQRRALNPRSSPRSRVLKLLAEGDLDPRRAGGDEIYRWTREAVPWHHLLRHEQTFAVEARVRSCTDVPSAMLAQVRIRDAVCDSISDVRCGRV